ncbi:hypothetical protein LXL04_016427 [Taraxacum kok-saghyz]
MKLRVIGELICIIRESRRSAPLHNTSLSILIESPALRGSVSVSHIGANTPARILCSSITATKILPEAVEKTAVLTAQWRRQRWWSACGEAPVVQSIASVVNRRWKTCLLDENRLKTEWKQQRKKMAESRRPEAEVSSAGGGGPVVHSIAGAG